MSTTLEINRLKPLGSNILVKRGPVETHMGKLGALEIPEEYQDRNELNGWLFTGTVIAVGPKTKSARFGMDRGWFEPGHKIWFWSKYDWADYKIVLKDEESGDEYLVISESEVKAYELPEIHAN